jgi:hypothetical protein
MPRPRKIDDTQQTSEPQLTGSVTPDAAAPAPEVTNPVTAPASGLPPLADLPEPSQEIFETPVETSKPFTEGEVWDPAVHEDPPRKNARGGWARRRGGARKSGATTASRALPPGERDEHEQLSPQEVSDKLDASANLAAGVLFMAGTMIVGKCMEPDDNERAGITTAFRDYFRATGTIEIPPWVGLLGAITLYGARRWNHPEVLAITGRDKKETEPSKN